LDENQHCLGLQHVEQGFSVGDVSLHSHWAFHHEGPNLTYRPRKVMTVIYMKDGARLKIPENPNQTIDNAALCPGSAADEPLASLLKQGLYHD
jgi:hypothetical protein